MTPANGTSPQTERTGRPGAWSSPARPGHADVVPRLPGTDGSPVLDLCNY